MHLSKYLNLQITELCNIKVCVNFCHENDLRILAFWKLILWVLTLLKDKAQAVN